MVLSNKGEYSIIARVKDNGSVHEYVVAWIYNEHDDSWAQGHYFFDLKDAMDYFTRITNKHLETKIDLLRKMNDYIRYEVYDEFAYSEWIEIVPDEASYEDLESIASDQSDWVYCCRMFGKIIKRYE